MSENNIKWIASAFLCALIVSASAVVYLYNRNMSHEDLIEDLQEQLIREEVLLDGAVADLERANLQVEELMDQLEATKDNYMELFQESTEIHDSLESLQQELESLSIKVSLKIDYGNGTVVWFNNTRIPPRTSLFNATNMLARLDYTVFDLGVFVNSINGVGEDPGRWWLWHHYDGKWTPGPIGSDQWILHEGDVVSWTYGKGF